MESEALMTGELIGRLLMVLTGFALMMLGVITFLHAGEHATLGTLISFSGFVAMLGGLQNA
jgi:hypothetical protein